jgi:hypothetical protein
MREIPRSGRRERLDMAGSLLVASGMLLLVFGISEGATYGWWTPLKTFSLGGAPVWPLSWPISIVPVSFAAAGFLLQRFHRLQVRKERERRDPLFDVTLLRSRSFRYGLPTQVVLGMVQTSFLLVISVVLQNGRHLSAQDTGLWLLPAGSFLIVGAQLGARLTRRIGAIRVVRIGLGLQIGGLILLAVRIGADAGFLTLFPGLMLVGIGIGFAASQLTNIVLSEVPAARAGAASGANVMMRMTGQALGSASVSALLSVFTIRYATDAIARAHRLGSSVRAHAIAGIRRAAVNYAPGSGTARRDTVELERLLREAISSAARPSLIFAIAVMLVGLSVSFLIPRSDPLPKEPPEIKAEANLFEGAL